MLTLRRLAFVLVPLFAMLRFAHVDLLWADEDYHLAAALDLLHGKAPYRDFWYDKPPLNAFYYLLIGAHWGWSLRLLDAAYVCVAAWLAFRLARDLWSVAEGYLAALLLAFFLTFYLPAAVIPFAADALLIVPHLVSIGCAQRRQFIWAGAWAGIGFLFNAKAVFVMASCLAWGSALVLAGFAIPVVIQCGVLALMGAWTEYVTEVWRWGLIYARSSPASDVLANAVKRVADWAGFHSFLVVNTVFGIGRNWRLAIWLSMSLVGIAVGGRFMPRYFLQALPPLTIIAAHGLVSSKKFCRFTLLLLLIPLLRFGPRYAQLAADRRPHWADVQLDEDSLEVANELHKLQQPGDTLFVWGYRPDIYVYSRMTPPGLFWDSQPLTGVPADRHLFAAAPVYGAEAAKNREQLAHSRPTFVVDGLGLLNPHLAPGAYSELRDWLARYQVAQRTRLSIIYRQKN